ncbi:MAG: hypothetical protein AB4050_01170 [Synechococcus sp.]
MPLPRWETPPTRKDPAFRFQDDRYTLGAHAMVYSAFVTGLWFFQLLYRADWPWLKPFVTAWTVALTVNAAWVLLLARYPGFNYPKKAQNKADVSSASSGGEVKSE